jgi:GLPGLI family protein
MHTNAQTFIIQYSERPIISAESLEKIPEPFREKRKEAKNFSLMYSNGLSLYKAENVNEKELISKKESEKTNEELGTVEVKTEIYKSTIKKSEKLYFKNYLEKEMLFIWPSGQENLSGRDSLQNWNWEITEETKIIEGFKCKKAISNWHNFESTAWFTEDISISIGPEKYDGLPGLILYVYTQYYEWKAVKINQIDNNSKIDAPIFNDKKTYTINEVNDIFNKKLKNQTPSITTTQEGNTTITTEKIIIK